MVMGAKSDLTPVKRANTVRLFRADDREPWSNMLEYLQLLSLTITQKARCFVGTS